MITKCGTDIIEISRVKEAMLRQEEGFRRTIFTEKEIKYCESKNMQKYQHYAARFAAKEAVFKTLSNNIENKDEWKHIEILNGENGRPYVNLMVEIKGLESIDISLSHCKEYAIAYVVANFKE